MGPSGRAQGRNLVGVNAASPTRVLIDDLVYLVVVEVFAVVVVTMVGMVVMMAMVALVELVVAGTGKRV